MKKKVWFLMGIGLVGIAVPSALASSTTLTVKAEEEVSTEAFSSVEETSSGFTSEEAISSADAVKELEDQIDDLSKQISTKVSDFKKTQTFAILASVVTIGYAAFCLIDKLSQRGLIKKTFSLADRTDVNVVKASQISGSADEAYKKLSDKVDCLKVDYDEVSAKLVAATKALEESTEANEKLLNDFSNLKSAFLELCKNDPDLIKSGAYEKISNIINGGE